jgi:hypothetical protein
MDRELRKLEREWTTEGNPNILKRFLRRLLHLKTLEAWEITAERGELYGNYIQLLRDFVDDSLSTSVVYVNVYEDYTARATLSAYADQITAGRRWLRDFYQRHRLFYQGREVFDNDLQEPIDDPPAATIIENTTEPCFRLYPSEIRDRAKTLGWEPNDAIQNPSALRRLSPINRWGQRDHYVSFQLIESFPDPDSIPPTPSQDTFIPEASNEWWVNAYEYERRYGGPEGGGWYYSCYDPIASIYTGPSSISREAEATKFLESFYGEQDIRVEPNPAIYKPFERPYYS